MKACSEKKKNRIRDHRDDTEYIMGRNPVREALKSGRKIRTLIVKEGSRDKTLLSIVKKAEEKGIQVERKDKACMDDMVSSDHHQGVIALAEPYSYVDLKDLIENTLGDRENACLVLTDGIEDPQNLGAIMRSAECAGALGLVIPKNRSVGVTTSVIKASAGASEYLPCARVTNLVAAIEYLKTKGFWVGACDMDGDPVYDADLTGRLALVIGNEGRGISRLVKERCDFIISIPLFGKIESLNASSAASVILYESVRQTRARKLKNIR